MKGRQLTRIVIAHRTETIAGAQRVVVVNGGKVTELLRALPIPALDATIRS